MTIKVNNDGRSKHPLYKIWFNMVDRCNNSKNHAYRHYGGRGITVCTRWASGTMGFWNFVDDIGNRPDGKFLSGLPHYSLDRIDNDGDYEANNIRWTTYKQQAKNRRPACR